MITVFTPTFNREKEIIRLYNSLCEQEYKNFEWLIIDDGSTDSTGKIVHKMLRENKLNIRYFKQINRGKHVAFNSAIDKCLGDMFICVDSDDYLTSNALLEIHNYYNINNKKDDLCGFVFLKGHNENEPITKYYPKDDKEEYYHDFIINKKFSGDKCEVFFSKILKMYSFPVFENEKFLSEGFLWSQIGRKYKYLFINKVIYICEYMPDGLTKSGRKLRINNPFGSMHHAEEYMDKSIYSFRVRIKNILLYETYYHFAQKKHKNKWLKMDYKKTGFLGFLIYFPSLLLFYVWNKKYGR